MRLKDKVALITGAAGCIGKEVAKRLAQEGAKLIVNDIDKDEIDKVVEEIKEKGGEAVGMEADVARKNEVQSMIDDVVKKFGRLDVLVNVAGVPKFGLVTEFTEDDWNFEMDVNLKGSFNCIQAAAKHMKKRKYGKIINTSSTAKDGVPWFFHMGNSGYASSKAGLVGLTRALTYELAPYNITVNCVVPGPIETPKTKQLFDSLEQDPKVEASAKKVIPLRRLGKPIDVANAILFLASDEANYITGHSLYVSGGLYGV